MRIKKHDIYPTEFLIGHKMTNGTIEKIGSVIVKGTFQDMDAPVVMPGESQAAVCRGDVLFNNNPEKVIRYESDMVPFKPDTDMIILGTPEPPDGLPSGMWYIVVETDTGLHIEKDFTGTNPFTIYGWAPRGEVPRLQQAGVDLEHFDPESMILPQGFENEFYNGWDRNITGDTPLPHLEDGVKLTIRSERRPAPPIIPPPPVSFQVFLPDTRPAATLRIKDENGSEEEINIPLALDTVIIEKELDTYIIVWRGYWDFEAYPPESYISLTVEGGVA